MQSERPALPEEVMPLSGQCRARLVMNTFAWSIDLR